MSNHLPPQTGIRFTDLPGDPAERHEVLVDLFGETLCWLRNWAISATKELAESAEAREQLGTIRRNMYEALAALPPEHRDVALKVSEATVDRFIRLLLTMLSGIGVDHRLGDDHAIRFKLDVEICDVENADVVEHETINRDGKKYFADYWTSWLNRFASRAGAVSEAE